MKHLVEITGNQAFVTSRVIAEGCHTQHDSVRRLIRNHMADIADINALDLKSRQYKTPGMTGTEYLLDEVQATFLLTLMRNDKGKGVVVAFKKRLTQDFFRQRDIISELIARQKDPTWIDTRQKGIATYHQKTNTIADFVEYADWEGSSSPNMYYLLLAKMENKALFIFEQKYKNLREVLTIRQLMLVSAADVVIEKALQEGMSKELPYKECFQLARARVFAFVELIGKSPILSLTEK